MQMDVTGGNDHADEQPSTQSAVRERSLSGPAFVLGASALALAVVFALTTPEPDWAAVVLFGALYVFAEHIDLRIPSGAALSGGFVVVVAAIVVFAAEGAPLGAVLVGSCGGLYFPLIRERQWAKLGYNAAMYALAMGAGVAVLCALPRAWLDSVPLLLFSATLAALAAFVVDALAVSYAMGHLHRRPTRDVLLTLAAWQWHVYPFAILGAALGRLYLDVGGAVLVLTVTPILVGRAAFAAYLRYREANEDALLVLVKALEAKDRYTAGHAERVAAYARYMGEELGLHGRSLERLRRAALMHDIGKLIVPNHLLNKPGPLTAGEYEQVRQHEDVTVALLSRIDFLAPVAPIALGVYAPWDDDHGRDAVARHIVAVADAYDAMTSTRAYRRALKQEVAFAELRAKSGSQFHPTCVEALIAALEQRGLHHGAGHERADAAAEWETAPPAAGPGSAGLGHLADERAG
jgi:HD domain